MSRHLLTCKNASTEAQSMAMQWMNKHVARQQPSLLPQLTLTPVPSSPEGLDSPSLTPTLLLPPTQPSRRQSFACTSEEPITSRPLSKQEQVAIEVQYLRALISAGWSFLSVDDPEVVKLVSLLNPSFKLPNRNKLSGPILDAEFNCHQNELMKMMKGSYATGQCDGWRDISRNHLVAFMISSGGMVS